MTRQKWLFPLISVAIFVFVLSLRQLSDPDLGFHLKYGSWISMNHTVPNLDQSTYTVSDHSYIDLHWLFQLALYQLYQIGGYPMISVVFCSLGLLLFLLLLINFNLEKIPVAITTPALFAAFVMFDPRLSPRPEMLTFLFLVSFIILLELYIKGRKKVLPAIPLIMLIWCNTHALFILGLVVMGVYLLGDTIRKNHVDRRLGIWFLVTLAASLVNPYGIKGFLFPFELLTRFGPDNIYNQHIQEFIPFFAQNTLQLRDYLFLALLMTSILLLIFRFRKFQLYELVLMVIFSLAGILSVRNIPLSVIIVLPIVCKYISTQILIPEKPVRVKKGDSGSSYQAFISKKLELPFFIGMVVLPLAFIPRLITNDYYISQNSFNKTGIGLDTSHQPYYAAEFLKSHRLEGRILNSLGFGGWLSWSLSQPVFIDGRLEVMQELLYKELSDSWDGGLNKLVEKYQIRIICYNYLKYYPWTHQLNEMKNWRLVWADGTTAIFIERNNRTDIPDFPINRLPSSETLSTVGIYNNWLQGFYKPISFQLIDSIHMSLFRDQMYPGTRLNDEEEKARTLFNAANERYKQNDIHGAIILFDSAICLNPFYAKAFNNRGIAWALNLHDYQNALADFNKAIEIDPEYGDAYFGRGSVYYALHQTEQAFWDWKKARALGNAGASRMLQLHGSRK